MSKLGGRPEFIYFDLGNVLIHFSHSLAAQQMAAAGGVSVDAAYRFAFEGPARVGMETGRWDAAKFCREFRAATGSRVSDVPLIQAASDIFWLNPSVIALVGQLASSGIRMGILSNTCQPHWDLIWRRFRVVRDLFAAHVLSFECGAVKPNREIFQAAITAARCPPDRIVFTDDLPENVAGAVACGLDAVPFESAVQFAGHLARRGLRVSY
jgi:putative hydrolase of the HAD superfamily